MQDFLESVIEAEPKPRLKRRKLADRDISALRDFTPDMAANSDSLFRTLGNRGIISYTEYLFLLTILIKPSSGFKIAFSMLDQDGNERIDKEEFKVLEAIFSAAAKDRKENSDVEEDDFGLQKEHHATIDTSLLIHFFGKSGGEELQFSEFCLFMENLQTEVLYMEFGEFSKGAPTISELDFARILLRCLDIIPFSYLAQWFRLIPSTRFGPILRKKSSDGRHFFLVRATTKTKIVLIHKLPNNDYRRCTRGPI